MRSAKCKKENQSKCPKYRHASIHTEKNKRKRKHTRTQKNKHTLHSFHNIHSRQQFRATAVTGYTTVFLFRLHISILITAPGYI